MEGTRKEPGTSDAIVAIGCISALCLESLPVQWTCIVLTASGSIQQRNLVEAEVLRILKAQRVLPPPQFWGGMRDTVQQLRTPLTPAERAAAERCVDKAECEYMQVHPDASTLDLMNGLEPLVPAVTAWLREHYGV